MRWALKSAQRACQSGKRRTDPWLVTQLSIAGASVVTEKCTGSVKRLERCTSSFVDIFIGTLLEKTMNRLALHAFYFPFNPCCLRPTPSCVQRYSHQHVSWRNLLFRCRRSDGRDGDGLLCGSAINCACVWTRQSGDASASPALRPSP